MEAVKIENLTFLYPNKEEAALNNINLTVNQGEMITLCGTSGCGKSTLLRHLKSVLTPFGDRSGNIYVCGQKLEELGQRQQSSMIGFVMQNPDNQIVTDKVWHELAFGLESLGVESSTIRLRVAEMASFFGIQTWFHKDVSELSGGQKQLLNLASIMAMQPSVLVLDEPTSQLDPIAAADFLATVGKINRELGTTVIITEHRLEDVIAMSDRVIVMENGGIIADGEPKSVGELLKNKGNEMFLAMPAPMRIYACVDNNLSCPITVREGRQWIDDINRERPVDKTQIEDGYSLEHNDEVIRLKDVWFRYEKDSADIVKGLNMSVKSGEMFAIVGGNGTGKTTTLSLISGINTPYRGTVELYGQDITKISDKRKFNGLLGVLPQNPQALFVEKTVEKDLYEMLSETDMSEQEKRNRVNRVVILCRLNKLLDMHPYDLSGGEQQRVGLAKVMLLEPRILLLDEPTKGLDAEFKTSLAEILMELLKDGTTIVMVSHDIEFCAEYADRCAMFFDGNIVTENTPHKFFSGNSFYTTSANRMIRHIAEDAVTVNDVIKKCGGKTDDKYRHIDRNKKPSLSREEIENLTSDKDNISSRDHKLSKRTMLAIFMILIAIPLTIFTGIYYLGDRKYYFISLLIILETMLPFALVFEDRKPQARELIIIAVLSAIAVAGRMAFFMVPQFKPVVAIVIIAGVCFGAESGFLVGAMTGFVSNFFFGQGPWTPWQMFAFGIIGFLAGILFQKGMITKTKISLCIYGALTTFVIYGGLMNPESVISFQSTPTKEMFMLAYIKGVPFDLIHAASTAIFLFFIAEPMIEKLERIKEKYGLLM